MSKLKGNMKCFFLLWLTKMNKLSIYITLGFNYLERLTYLNLDKHFPFNSNCVN